MTQEIQAAALRPPLKAAWTAPVDLVNVIESGGALYGITGNGKVVALDPATGAVRWQTTSTHLRNRLTARGNVIFAYKKDDGLNVIRDTGTGFTEKVIVKINPLTEADPVSNIVTEGSNLYMVINQALLVLTDEGDLIAGTGVGSQTPYMIAAAGPNQCVAVDAYGQPQLFRLQGSSLTRTWIATMESPGTAPAERPLAVSDGCVIAGGNGGTTAFNLHDGSVRWQHGAVAAKAILLGENTAYLVGQVGEASRVRVSNGEALWRRMYLYPTTQTVRVSASLSDTHLYIGAWVASGGPVHCFALQAVTGAFEWQVSGPVSGVPVVAGNRLIVYGTSAFAVAMEPVPGARVGASMVTWSPNPLRGASAGFTGTFTINLPVRATITVNALRETVGAGARLIDRAEKDAGAHELSWNAGGAGGFSDANQFGRLMIDVTEEGGTSYTVAKLVPVNTLPDLLGHWAQTKIETMVYLKYIGGYPDLTFKPDNLITRAETSNIIAKTLSLEGPSPGFKTNFTDISDHWARQQIMALEERGIIGGFQEADGTYTFRPDTNMTRAQEARILVKAYEIPAAPTGWNTKFTDISGHWAKPDIEALEAQGYVNGFREENGTFTYRPERSLTRAELCTVVVRIRKLTRA